MGSRTTYPPRPGTRRPPPALAPRNRIQHKGDAGYGTLEGIIINDAFGRCPVFASQAIVLLSPHYYDVLLVILFFTTFTTTYPDLLPRYRFLACVRKK
jgi:hypothetical protein